MKDKILQWLCDGETGVSSSTIAYRMIGLKYKHEKSISHPGDPDDFKRCLKLLIAIPEIRLRLDEMRSISKHWNAIVEHWKEVEDCFMDEVGGWLVGKYLNKSATKTYELMQKIYDEVEK